MWQPRHLTTLWDFMARYRDSFTFLFLLHKKVKTCRWQACRVHARFLLNFFSTLKTEVICSSDTSVDTQRTTLRYIPEDDTLHNYRCENLKSYMWINVFIHEHAAQITRRWSLSRFGRGAVGSAPSYVTTYLDREFFVPSSDCSDNCGIAQHHETDTPAKIPHTCPH
jgi:hypothetical protein